MKRTEYRGSLQFAKLKPKRRRTKTFLRATIVVYGLIKELIEFCVESTVRG